MTRYLNYIISFLIQGLRPLLGPTQCRFEPSCGNYALEQLQHQSLVTALWRISKRLFSCNPFWPRSLQNR